MHPLTTDFAEQVLALIKIQSYSLLGAIQDNKVVLGGSGGSAGGVGEPPAGFIGQLIQSNVTFDTAGSIRACSAGSSGSSSLVDNLDAIRLGDEICNDAIGDRHIDWGHGSGQVGAEDVPVSSGSLSSTNVHDALEELYGMSSGSASDHGTLTGLGDDDHPHYLLADGTRDLTVPDNQPDAWKIIDAGDANDYLTIVSTDGSREVVINQDGHANIDFRVEGSGVPSAFVVRGSDGAVYTDFGIGIGTYPTSTFSLNLDMTYTAVAGTTRGISCIARLDPAGASAGDHYGAQLTTRTTDGNAQNFTGTTTGFRGAFVHDGDGTVDEAAGIRAYVGISGSSTGGVITEAAGLKVESFLDAGAGASELTTIHGIKVEDQTAGVTNRAISTGAGEVYFGDNVGIQTTAIGTELTLVGDSVISIATPSDDGYLGLAGTDALNDQLAACIRLNGINEAANAGDVEIYAANGAGCDIRFFGTGAERVTFLSNGRVGIGTTTVPHGAIGVARVAVEGTDASGPNGPHMQFTTNSDDYPLFSIRNWQHDDIAICFDAYYDSTAVQWESSDPGSSYRIYKTGDLLYFQSDVANAGAVCTWPENHLVLNATTGNTGVGANPGGEAQLYVDQTGAGGAIPVLGLYQQDDDEPFIKFRGTAAAGTLTNCIVDYGDEGSSTAAVWLKVEVEDFGDQVADQDYHILAYILSA